MNINSVTFDEHYVTWIGTVYDRNVHMNDQQSAWSVSETIGE